MFYTGIFNREYDWTNNYYFLKCLTSQLNNYFNYLKIPIFTFLFYRIVFIRDGQPMPCELKLYDKIEM